MARLRNAVLWLVCGGLFVLSNAGRLAAQQAPSIGYIQPAGGQIGSTVEARLGGYDWTPDMQVFSLDPRVKLDALGPPGEVIVPEPPYWFGKKGRGVALPMPRETAVRLTLSGDISTGPVAWQAANANGATARGVFYVSQYPISVETKRKKGSEVPVLPTLPTVVAGQVQKIEEVDRYRFSVPQTGPVTVQIFAKRLNSPLHAILEIRDRAGNMLAEVADTEHRDPALTIAAQAGEEYTVSLYDLDFRGDRSFTYLLECVARPQVVAAMPASVKRGESASLTFVGYGVATGAATLETLTRTVTAPAAAGIASWDCAVETPFGIVTVPVGISDNPQAVEPADLDPTKRPLAALTGVTGTLGQHYEEDRYQLQGDPKQPVWIAATAAEFGTALDVSITVLNAKGETVASNDDLPGTTDAGLLFTAPAAEPYFIAITDASGRSGSAAAVYHLSVSNPRPDFEVKVTDQLSVPIGTKATLPITVDRRQGFNEPIKIQLENLPAGVTVPADLTIAAGASDLKVELTSAADAPAVASLLKVTATGTVAGQTATRTTDPVLIASTLKPPFTIDAGGKDDVSKWPRGTAFPAPVIIERQPGFNGEIRLEMAGFNDRHRQGIRGPEMMVPPGVNHVTYPVTLPEWLETTRTSRIILNGVAKIKDPKGNERHVVSRLLTRIGFLPGGALLKVAHKTDELKVDGVQPFSIPVHISRSPQLTAPVKLELIVPEDLSGLLSAEPIELQGPHLEAELRITPKAGVALHGRHELTIRSSSLKDDTLPVISETTVAVEFPAGNSTAAAK